MKKTLLVLSLCFFSLFINCKKNIKPTSIQLSGMVFGTTYSIKYLNHKTNFQPQIDSLFNAINTSLSTYIPTSDISKINNGDTIINVDDFFIEVFEKSRRIYDETDGYFDPTVGNLVNAWGFGPEKTTVRLDTLFVKKQMKYVGFQKLQIIHKKVVKQFPEIYLDFNSIAKGYGIDIIGRFLESKKIENYLVEIGGEIRSKGFKHAQKPWVIQLTNPINPDAQFKRFILSNKSMATSGNYRKYSIDENGQKYVHTINPKTGFATESNLLSASVIANLDCADVDAYATAFMAMGFEKTIAFLKKKPSLNVILYYINKEGVLSEYTNYKEL